MSLRSLGDRPQFSIRLSLWVLKNYVQPAKFSFVHLQQSLDEFFASFFALSLAFSSDSFSFAFVFSELFCAFEVLFSRGFGKTCLLWNLGYKVLFIHACYGFVFLFVYFGF